MIEFFFSFFAWRRAKGSVHEYKLDFNVGRRIIVLPGRTWSISSLARLLSVVKQIFHGI